MFYQGGSVKHHLEVGEEGTPLVLAGAGFQGVSVFGIRVT